MSWHYNPNTGKSLIKDCVDLLNEDYHLEIATNDTIIYVTCDDDICVGDGGMMITNHTNNGDIVTVLNTSYIVMITLQPNKKEI